MIRVVKPGTDYKIADKWEQDPWIIVHKCTDSPVYRLQKTHTQEIKELHCNLLYPLRLVSPDTVEPQLLSMPLQNKAVDTLVGVRANQVQLLTDKYFACDCENCTETV